VLAAEQFTLEWVTVLGEACYLTWGSGKASSTLAPLVDALAAAMGTDDFDPEGPRAIGRQLAEANFRGPTALPGTMRLIRTRAPQLFPTAGPDRIGELLDELAAGYAEGLRQITQSEQEELLAAVLRARQDTEAVLRASEDRFRTIFTEAGAGIAIVTADGEVTSVNPAIVQMFGDADSLAQPHSFTDHMHPEDIDTVAGLFRDLIEGRCRPMRGEARFIRPDGTVLWTYLTASLVRDGAGLPEYVIAVLEDVTERYQLRSRLHHQTYHDQLTRLPNRSLMEEQLAWAFSDGSAVHRVGLCHLDLDGFRAVNDTMGHQVGDQLLLAVSSRLQLISDGNLVTRAGADEFTILVPDPAGAAELTELADRILAGLGPPFVLGQRRLSITASLGIAEAAVCDTSPAELHRAADAARSWAKEAGGGRWAVFDPGRDAQETARFALAIGIAGAVDREEFRLHYQPLVQLDTGELTGVEALVRWSHPEHGLLGPSEFIGLAERNSSIVPLGRWVLEQACRQARQWADELGDAAPYMSVNVAPRQLAEPGWLAEVSQVLDETGLDPSLLQLEITERAVLVDESGAEDTLRALRDMGIRLAIDDFGTGYSSLSYLRRLPVHGLKIDGSFIRGLREANSADSKDDKIIKALITMAHALDLVVTAEWVETASQAHRLAALGCDIGQGNWYGHPVPATQLAPLLRRPLAG
jgi:diguanylate cyclase (GGDEF)-like protein/PAS domain S-box-containing protein